MISRHHLKPGLEPPDISELAQALANREWLDMRVVDAGDFERVRIDCLHIYSDRDVVTVVQNFRMTPDAAGLTQYALDVDCEDIMYMLPTGCEGADEVVPIEAPEKAPTKEHDSVKDAAIAAVVEVTGGSIIELIKALAAGHGRHAQDVVNQRHLVLWAVFEMTDLSPSDICWELGWRSPMPFQSARYKFTGKHADEKWRKIIAEIVKRAREAGGTNWRREDERWRDVCILP